MKNGDFSEFQWLASEDVGPRAVDIRDWHERSMQSIEVAPTIDPRLQYAVELNKHYENGALSQVIENVQSGRAYLLTFERAAWDESSILELYWGGQRIITLSKSSINAFYTWYFVVVGGAGDGSNRLEFREIGSPDCYGTRVAKVQMYPCEDLHLVAKDRVVQLPSRLAELTDDDFSEVLQLVLEDVPIGVRLTDGQQTVMSGPVHKVSMLVGGAH